MGWVLQTQHTSDPAAPTEPSDNDSDDNGVAPHHLVNRTPEGYGGDDGPFTKLNIQQGEANQDWVADQNIQFANCYSSGKVSVLVPSRSNVVALVSPIGQSRLKHHTEGVNNNRRVWRTFHQRV